MRYLAVIAIVVPIIAAGYVLGRMPRPETRAQVAARVTVDSLTRGRLEALERRDAAAWAAPLRQDGVVITPDPGAPLIGPVAAAAWMRRDSSTAGPAITGDVEPQRVATGATRRGRLAWAALPLGSVTARATRMHSMAWLERDGEWRVLVEHGARVGDWEALRAAAAARRFPAQTGLEAPQGRGAERLARRFERWLPDFGGRRLDREAIAVGPMPDAPAVGDSAVKVMLAGWAERFGKPRVAPGGIAAWAPRGRGVGWVAANLEVTPPGWGGATLPLRITCVYRDTGEDSWRLVLAHLSVAMPEAAILGPPS